MKQSKHLTLVGVTLVVASLIAVLPSEAKTDLTKKNVVGIWLFDEIKGDQAKDTSENGLDGKIEGKVKVVDGKFGQALQFNAAGYVEIPFNELLNIKQAYDLDVLGSCRSGWSRSDSSVEAAGLYPRDF